jgi:hypothetical protein
MTTLGIHLDTKATIEIIQNSDGSILYAYDKDRKLAIYSDQQAGAAEENTAIDYRDRYRHILI